MRRAGVAVTFNYGSAGVMKFCCRSPVQYFKGWFVIVLIIVISDWLLLLAEKWKSSYGDILRVSRVRTRLGISRLLKVLRLLRWAIRRHYDVGHDKHRTTIYLLEAFFSLVQS